MTANEYLSISKYSYIMCVIDDTSSNVIKFVKIQHSVLSDFLRRARGKGETIDSIPTYRSSNGKILNARGALSQGRVRFVFASAGNQ